MRGALLLSLLALGGCAGTAAGGGPTADAIAAADLIQAGQAARLAAGLGPASDAVAAGSVAVALDEAANGLITDGATLRAGVTRPHDAAAHIELALPGFDALQSGYEAAGPSGAAQAGRVQAYRAAFLAAARTYDADAPAAGMPQAALPAR